MRTVRYGAPVTGASTPPTRNVSANSARRAAGNRRQGRRRGPDSGGLRRRLRDLARNRERTVAYRDADRLAVGDLAPQHLLRQRVLQRALNHPFQRPGAIDRIVAGLGEPVARLVVDVEHDLAVVEQLLQPRELDIDDAAHVAAREPP